MDSPARAIFPPEGEGVCDDAASTRHISRRVQAWLDRHRRFVHGHVPRRRAWFAAGRRRSVTHRRPRSPLRVAGGDDAAGDRAHRHVWPHRPAPRHARDRRAHGHPVGCAGPLRAAPRLRARRRRADGRRHGREGAGLAVLRRGLRDRPHETPRRGRPRRELPDRARACPRLGTRPPADRPRRRGLLPHGLHRRLLQAVSRGRAVRFRGASQAGPGLGGAST